MPDTGTINTFLGFDFGTRRIGIAVGNRYPRHSAPLLTLKTPQSKIDWTVIDKLIATWQVQALVVGIPLQLDGSTQTTTKQARRFARQLHERYQLPVHEADERMSTMAAESLHKHQRQLGKRKTAESDLDKLAASLILADWLSEQFPTH